MAAPAGTDRDAGLPRPSVAGDDPTLHRAIRAAAAGVHDKRSLVSPGVTFGLCAGTDSRF